MLTIFSGCGDDDKSDDVATPEKRVNITVSPAEATVDFGGGVVELTVTADGDWSVMSQSDFCTVNRKGGIKGETKIKATITKNTSADTRTAVLNFLGGKTSLQYSITQDYDRASFDNNEITAPEGYRLVWHDEFDGESLSNDWTYEVQNSGWVNNELQNYRKSEIDGKKTAPAIVHVLVQDKEANRVVLEMILHEGKNREIRKMCAAVGLEVARLRRTQIGGVKMGMLKQGDWRDLTEKEVKNLLANPIVNGRVI